jgi:single-strand DNA-binding protein
MSNSFAYAQVGGSLGKDPESRSTPSGVKVVKFSIAVEQGYGDRVSTGWHDIVAFGDVAAFAEKHLKKGSSVRVIGTTEKRSWDDKQSGQKRYSTEVIAQKIDFGDSGQKSGGSAPATRQQAAPPARQQAVPAARAQAEADPFDDDSIPF